MRRRLPILIWLAWLGFGLGWLWLRTPVSTDLTFFLPRTPTLLDSILVQQMREGPASRMLLIAIGGGTPADRIHASRRIVEALRPLPMFETVLNGPDPRSLAGLETRLFRYRYALSPAMAPDHFDGPSLRASLEQRLGELASPAGWLEKNWLPRDPTGTWMALLTTWLPATGPALEQGVWVSGDGQRALVLARTRASGFDLEAQAVAQEAVHTAFGAQPEAARLTLILGGPGALGVEANAEITADAARLSLVNGLLVLLLMGAVYRSARVLGLSLLPLATGLVSGATVTSLAFGGVHGITLGFGATLVGVAADYPNHYFTHLSPRETPAGAMRRIWPTLRLGLLTNIAGFAAMLFSGFVGLAQLAVFAGAGLLGAGLSTRGVLPALSAAQVRLPAWVERGLPSRRPGAPPALRWLPAGLTAVAGLAFVSLDRPLWNDDIAVMNPVPLERLHQDEALQRDFGAPDLRQLLVVAAASAEAALRGSEALTPVLDRLRADGVLGDYDAPGRYLPSAARQAERLAAIPAPEILAARLRQALAGLPFRNDAFAPFLREAAAARLAGPATRHELAGTPLADRLDGLLLPVGASWAALLPLARIADPSALADRIAALDRADVRLLDLRAESTRLMRDYRQEALRLLAGSLIAIVLLLAAGLRSLRESLRVIAPVLLAGLCTGLIMAIGFRGLNLYHLVSLLLVMGLSLDQALFFNQDAADPEQRRRTLLSLLVCSASAVLAFGTLALSRVNILQAIGTTVAVGAILAIGFAALLAQRPRVPR